MPNSSTLCRSWRATSCYILSGTSNLRLIPWAYGKKGTGKSTFTELLQTVLGKNAAIVDPRKLRNDADRERLGSVLWNRRLALCSEAGNKRIEAELLKTLSGGDTLTVRFLYQDPFDAIPRHVLMMVANDAPSLDAYDDALKDRILALPFEHRLQDAGALPLTGSSRIETVRKMVDSPTVSSNELKAGIAKGHLRDRYVAWCDEESLKPYGSRLWAKAYESIGLYGIVRGKKNVRYWVMSSKGHKPGKDPGSDDNPNGGGDAGGGDAGSSSAGGNSSAGGSSSAGGGGADASAAVADLAAVRDPATGVVMENWEVSAVDTLVDDHQHNNPAFCPTCKAWTSPGAVAHLSEEESLEAAEGYRAHRLAVFGGDAPDPGFCATCGNRANPTSVAHLTLEEALAIKPVDTKPGELAPGDTKPGDAGTGEASV